jgi:uncharacterized protein YcbX
MPMALQISELNIYPVKGLRGFSVKEADAIEKGFRYDRRWMVTDANGMFLTQRELPKMALIATSLVGESLVITYKDSSVMVPLNSDSYSGNKQKVQVWDDVVDARVVGKNLNEWFSDVLHKEVLFCFQHETYAREVEKKYGAHSMVSFADGYPFLFATEASLELVNQKIAEDDPHSKPLPMNRFRPNIVVAGAEPFEEDNWGKISVGDAVFHCLKPCARCPVPTIDQETAVMGKEPTRTLAKFRKKDNKVFFGMNAVIEKPGKVKVGDVLLHL